MVTDQTSVTTDQTLPPLPFQPTVPQPQEGISQQAKVSFDAPQNWGTTNSIPTPNIQGVSHNSISVEEEVEPGTSPLKVFLISIALILLGILIGVLVAKFYAPAPTNQVIVTPTPSITVAPTEKIATSPAELIASPSAVASMSAIPNLNWKTYSTDKYKLFYPSTWSFKYSPEKITLTKLKNIVTIVSNPKDISDYCLAKTVFQVNKTNLVWEVKEASTSSHYHLCETKNKIQTSSSSIGEVDLKGTKIDSKTLDEFKYILEKIQIITPNSTK